MGDRFPSIYPLVICDIAIEHGHRKFVDFPIKNGGSFHSFLYVYQRVTTDNGIIEMDSRIFVDHEIDFAAQR